MITSSCSETAGTDPLSDVISDIQLHTQRLEELGLPPLECIVIPDGVVAFYVVVEGAGSIVVGRGQSRTAFSAGELFVLPQPFSHRVEVSADGPARVIACHLVAPCGSSSLFQWTLPAWIRVPSNHGRIADWLGRTVSLMLAECRSSHPGHRGIVDSPAAFNNAFRRYAGMAAGVFHRRGREAALSVRPDSC